jgi:sugar phosphate isomerase/epimerase
MIARLKELGRRHAVGFNIHLPTDVTLAADAADVRQVAAERIGRVYRRVAPLRPAFHVLHLEMPSREGLPTGHRASWETRAHQGLEQLAREGIDFGRLRIENQHVPLDWLAALAASHDLGLCLDIGHLQLAGESLATTLARHHDRIRALHVHGVAGGRDHRALSCLRPAEREVLVPYLQSFRGSVSVEIFDFDGLCQSLRLLAEWLG